MNSGRRSLLLGSLIGLLGVSLCFGGDDDCGFSKYKARRITHFAEKAATVKIAPDYPEDAERKGLTGDVMIRVLINRHGEVVKTCPVFEQNKARPDGVLVAAAQAAAVRWKFKPNFAFEGQQVKFRYVQDVIVFKFVPGQAKSAGSPNP